MLHLTLDRKSVYKAIKGASAALNANHPRQALQCLHLEAKGKTLTVTATDGNLTIRRTAPIEKNTKAGAALVHGARLPALLRDLTDDTVTLKVTEKSATLTAPGASFRLPTMAVSDYIEMPTMPETDVSVEVGMLTAAVGAVAYALKTEMDGRFALDSISLRSRKDELEFAATDGRRMGMMVVAADTPTNAIPQCPVPPIVLEEAAKLADDEVRLCVDKGRLFAEGPNGMLVACLYDGTHPQHADMIPGDDVKPDVTVSVNTEAFWARMQQAKHMTDDRNRAAVLNLAPDSISIKAASSKAGEAELAVPAECKGNLEEIPVNTFFMLDLIAQCPDETMTFSGYGTALVMRAPGIVHLLAKVRLGKDEG